MAKHWKWYALGAMVLAQWVIPLQMIGNSEAIFKKGTAFRFECAPIDPNDPFRGKYIVLNFTLANYIADTADAYTNGQQVYAVLGTDSSGYATILALKEKQPDTGHYLITRVDYTHTYNGVQTVVLDIPFSRYYLDEFDAPKAEEKYREGTQSRTAYAEVYLYKGQARVKDVVVDGKPLAQWLGEE